MIGCHASRQDTRPLEELFFRTIHTCAPASTLQRAVDTSSCSHSMQLFRLSCPSFFNHSPSTTPFGFILGIDSPWHIHCQPRTLELSTSVILNLTLYTTHTNIFNSDRSQSSYRRLFTATERSTTMRPHPHPFTDQAKTHREACPHPTVSTHMKHGTHP